MTTLSRHSGFFLAIAVACAVAFSAVAMARADDTTTTPDASAAPAQLLVATSTDGTGGIATSTGGTIITGDAVASTTVDNELNISVSNLPDAPCDPTSKNSNNRCTNSSNLNDLSTSTGELDSTATSTADTGSNTTVGGQAANTIVTGNAIATANVINEVNTNIFNSEGLILFLNQLFGGGFDLNNYDLSYFFAGGPGASPTSNPTTKATCTLLTCLNSSSLNILSTSTAAVSNSVIVRASTGTNVASSTADAVINTGDAYAAANVVNLVNTNIVNSSYLLLSFNNFGTLHANITLPGSDFFQRLFANGEATSSMNASTYAVQNSNNVTLTGTTTADATTGKNLASTTNAFTDATSTGNGIVTTGDAYSSANTYNQVNTNSIGGTSIFMLFRVAGTWTGSIIGLPAGITETIIPYDNYQLIELTSTGASTTLTSNWLQQYNSSHFLSAATSTASVDNNIDVSADTGNNHATTDTGTAYVSTGNAYAAASVVNLVNTNIVGQNWIFSVFNIFGDMDGDIVFGGSPNLAVSAQPSVITTAPGSDVTYTFAVTNSGTADAGNVVLNTSFDNTLLSFISGDMGATTTPTGRSWNLGIIPQGQTRTFTFTAHVNNNFPAGQSATVPLLAAAVNNNITAPSTSNTANASIVVSSPAAPSSNTQAGNSGGAGGGGGGGGIISNAGTGWSADPLITIIDTSDTSSTTIPATVSYKVFVSNNKNAGGLYNSVLTDTLYDPSGNVMYSNSWGLDTVAPGDDITLTFSVAFSSTSVPGIYHNVSELSGTRGNPLSTSDARLLQPFTASTDIQLLPSGLVLGVATSSPAVEGSSTCAPIITTYLRSGSSNKAEVQKLQQFLNKELNASLPLTGRFGPLTTSAVSVFQRKYASDILTPFGITRPTGSVYASTQRKINELACGSLGVVIQNAINLGVSAAQQQAAAPAVSQPSQVLPKSNKLPKKTSTASPTKKQNQTPPVSSPPAPAPKSGAWHWLQGIVSSF